MEVNSIPDSMWIEFVSLEFRFGERKRVTENFGMTFVHEQCESMIRTEFLSPHTNNTDFTL